MLDRPLPQSDPAAEFAIAANLYDEAHKRITDVSGPFQGADQFMRHCMAIGRNFEAWACANVEFDFLCNVWPYLLHERFYDAWDAVMPIRPDTLYELGTHENDHQLFAKIMDKLKEFDKA